MKYAFLRIFFPMGKFLIINLQLFSIKKSNPIKTVWDLEKGKSEQKGGRTEGGKEGRSVSGGLRCMDAVMGP